ncbi:MAG: chemotaxis protein CheV [Desulfamplus sp.]|nr:chemotaxis protein CheV [Desulfamplus sp.]MBF0390721.1 chemotaxis protein CheV [Desulfamplus sp.]
MGTIDNEPEAYLKSGSNELKILEYTIGRLHLGINILKVSRILDRPEKVSGIAIGAHKSVIGLFEDHGHIIPLVDLGDVMGVKSSTGGKRVIITEFFNEITGFLVDAVERVHTLSWDKVRSAEDIMGALENPYVLAITRPNDKEMVLLLDYEKVVLELAPELAQVVVTRKNFDEWSGAGYTILVAEDSTPVRQMLTMELEELGFKVISARDGEEAVALFDESSEINLVISDVEMPRRDGLSLLGHIRKHPKRNITPVIIYSSIGDIGMKERARVMAANGHITKLEMDSLFEQIRTILEKY